MGEIMYTFNKDDRILREFERKVSIIVNMQISDKITSKEAYERIKESYSIVKKHRKKHQK